MGGDLYTCKLFGKVENNHSEKIPLPGNLLYHHLSFSFFFFFFLEGNNRDSEFPPILNLYFHIMSFPSLVNLVYRCLEDENQEKKIKTSRKMISSCLYKNFKFFFSLIMRCLEWIYVHGKILLSHIRSRLICIRIGRDYNNGKILLYTIVTFS